MNLFRGAVWMLLRFLYRIKVQGLDRIPDGAAVLTPNHVSYIDAILISAHIKRQVTFAMYWKIFNRFKWIVAPLGAIPIAPKEENPTVYQEAFGLMGAALDRGELVCIFPEGMLTRNGEMNEFKNGLRKLLVTHPVKVVPVGLVGLWGTYFSRKSDSIFRIPNRWMTKIAIRIGKPLDPDIDLAELQNKVARLIKRSA